MKYSNLPFLFTLILSALLLNGCASTGATPGSETAAATEAPATTTVAPAAEAKPATKKKSAAPGAEPECD